MTANRLTIFAIGIDVLVTVGGTTSAFAWSKFFPGTRDQVRTACASVGGKLTEGTGTTSCANGKNGTWVQCSDSGNCAGSGPGPAPRSATYGILMPFDLAPATQGPVVAGSLSSPSDSSSGSGILAAPSGGDSGGDEGSGPVVIIY